MRIVLFLSCFLFSFPVFAQVCTKDYRPVCGIDGVTYANKCTAQDNPIAYEGECVWGNSFATRPSSTATCTSYHDGCNSCNYGDNDTTACTMMFCEEPGRPYCHHDIANSFDDVVCTMDYRPVCGIVDGNVQTFGNRCGLDATINAVFLHPSACVSDPNGDHTISLTNDQHQTLNAIVERLSSLSPRVRHRLSLRIQRSLELLYTRFELEVSDSLYRRYYMLAFVLESLRMHH